MQRKLNSVCVEALSSRHMESDRSELAFQIILLFLAFDKILTKDAVYTPISIGAGHTSLSKYDFGRTNRTKEVLHKSIPKTIRPS
jgi:hypothetical protein